MASKCTVVNPWHWLEEDGSFLEDTKIRGRAIRVAQCIEYGGPLDIGEGRETLIACRFRPAGTRCPGFIVVLKQSDDAISAFCPTCDADEFLIYEWEETPWANGPATPVKVVDLARQAGKQPPKPRVPGPENLSERLTRGLEVLGSHMSAKDVHALIAMAEHPTDVLQAVVRTLPRPPTQGAMERFLPVLGEAWNATPRDELGGWTPTQMQENAAPRPRASPKVGRNAPCPCGSGKKYKRCCGRPDRLH